MTAGSLVKPSGRPITRVGIYVRVRSAEQAEGHSLDYQAEACRTSAAKLGAQNVTVYEDAGISATTANRPAFQRMVADAENGLLDAVIVYKLDRFSRKRIDAL